MIVVDASVIIALLDARDAQHSRAVRVLGEVASPLAASVVTLAEVLVGPARAGRLAEADAALSALDLHSVPLGPDRAERLATIRAQAGLKLPDCCVLLAAEDAGAAAVLTFDERLRRAADGLGFPDLPASA